ATPGHQLYPRADHRGRRRLALANRATLDPSAPRDGAARELVPEPAPQVHATETAPRPLRAPRPIRLLCLPQWALDRRRLRPRDRRLHDPQDPPRDVGGLARRVLLPPECVLSRLPRGSLADRCDRRRDRRSRLARGHAPCLPRVLPAGIRE